jgi:hypothetical protein
MEGEGPAPRRPSHPHSRATRSASPPGIQEKEPRCRSNQQRDLVVTRGVDAANFADEDGNTIAPASIGLPPEIPQEVRHLVTFNALGEHRTELTVTEYGYVSDQILELSKAGLEQVLDKRRR